jgi:cytochrome c
MEFLKEIALPQPLEHFQLLHFIMNMLLIIYLPSLGFVMGSSLLAVRCARRSRATGDPLEARLARDLIGTTMFNKSGVTFFVVLPALGLVFIFAQLLQGTPAIASGLMAFAFLTILIGVTLLYAFRYNLELQRVLSATPGMAPGAKHLRESNAASLAATGRWGTILTLIGAGLSLGAISITVNRASWTGVSSVFDLLVNADFWVRSLHFLAVSLGATGIGMLFFLFQWEGGVRPVDEAYEDSVRKIAIRLAAISLLAQPLLMIGSVALLPKESLTGSVFALAGASLAFLFLTAMFLYAYHREHRALYTSYAFVALGVAFFLVFTKDQIAIRNATSDRAASLAVAADREVDVLKARMGVAAATMSGQEIYDARCSACHMFDQKKVGPPYKEVIPKYEGKKAGLMAFVLNPVKVNPAYPNMPNQGLRPAEADSIATFLLAKFAGESPGPAAPAKKP